MCLVLESLPRFKKGDHVFSTTFGEKPVNGFSKAKERLDGRVLRSWRAIARLRGEGRRTARIKPWVIHDIRRTMRTGLSALPVPDLVRELVIAHTKPGLHKVYDQHAYESEKRHALELWAARLRNIVEPPADNVVPLAARRLTLAVGDAMVCFGKARGRGMHSANIEPEALDGLLIGEAIRQFAFDDPAVQAIRNTLRYSKKQSEAFQSLFENGYFLWPLEASADDLARILYPAIRIVRDEEHEMGDPPEEVMLAAKTIAAVFSQIVGFLHEKELLAHDEQNNEFDRWGRPGLAINVETSDLWDCSGSVLRKSLRLSVPITAQRTAASKTSTASTRPDVSAPPDGRKHRGGGRSREQRNRVKSILRTMYPPNGLPPTGSSRKKILTNVNHELTIQNVEPVALDTLGRALRELKLEGPPTQ